MANIFEQIDSIGAEALIHMEDSLVITKLAARINRQILIKIKTVMRKAIPLELKLVLIMKQKNLRAILSFRKFANLNAA